MKAEMIIDTKDTHLQVKNKSFFIKNNDEERIIHPNRISSISILTNVQIQSNALKLAVLNDIPVQFCDPIGSQLLELRSSSYRSHVALRRKQMIFMNSARGFDWVKKIINNKTDLQLESLCRWSIGVGKERQDQVQSTCSKMLYIQGRMMGLSYRTNYRNTIMGMEGSIARLYFSQLSDLLPKQYYFAKRSRQPGLDYFNVGLNYMYGMTYSHVSKALLSCGLDTYVGALHIATYRECLVFDMIECIRPWIDRLLMELCASNLVVSSDFRPYRNGYLLNKRGKRKLIRSYNDFIHRRFKWEGKVLALKYHIYRKARALKNNIIKSDIDVHDML